MAQAARSSTASTDDAALIVRAYLPDAKGDAGLALRWVIADALAYLCAAERRTQARERLISRGFIRAGL